MVHGIYCKSYLWRKGWSGWRSSPFLSRYRSGMNSLGLSQKSSSWWTFQMFTHTCTRKSIAITQCILYHAVSILMGKPQIVNVCYHNDSVSIKTKFDCTIHPSSHTESIVMLIWAQCWSNHKIPLPPYNWGQTSLCNNFHWRNAFENVVWNCWHRPGSTLDQVMACCLTEPSHYLNQR